MSSVSVPTITVTLDRTLAACPPMPRRRALDPRPTHVRSRFGPVLAAGWAAFCAAEAGVSARDAEAASPAADDESLAAPLLIIDFVDEVVAKEQQAAEPVVHVTRIYADSDACSDAGDACDFDGQSVHFGEPASCNIFQCSDDCSCDGDSTDGSIEAGGWCDDNNGDDDESWRVLGNGGSSGGVAFIVDECLATSTVRSSIGLALDANASCASSAAIALRAAAAAAEAAAALAASDLAAAHGDSDRASFDSTCARCLAAASCRPLSRRISKLSIDTRPSRLSIKTRGLPTFSTSSSSSSIASGSSARTFAPISPSETTPPALTPLTGRTSHLSSPMSAATAVSSYPTPAGAAAKTAAPRRWRLNSAEWISEIMSKIRRPARAPRTATR
nr:hypothetical protein HK105_001687 [Polyrhizophydium stewartii]